MKKFLALLLLIVMALGCFASCKEYDNETKIPPTNEEFITERIETFLTAYNTGDMEAVLECLDTKTRNAFQAMVNLLGGLAGAAAGFDIDLSDLFSLGVSMTQGDFMELEITAINVIDSSNAIATTVMNLVGAGTQTIYFEMVYENDGWYIHDMTDRKPDKTNGSQGDSSNAGDSMNTDDDTNNGGNNIIVSNYEISTCEPFVDGRAWVKYYDRNENQYAKTYYYGFIDLQGNVIYSIPANGVEIYNIGKGSGIVCFKDRMILIGDTGEIRLELTGHAEVKHYGGGYAWIYQNKSTITSLEHLYGLTDYTGVWIEPMENLYEEGLYDDIQYIGDGFMGARERDSVVYPIWNADKSIMFTIDGHVSDRHISFENGVALVDCSHYWDDTISITVTKRNENGQEETTVYSEIQLDCLIFANGRVLPMDMIIPHLNWNKAFYDGKAVTEIFDLQNGIIKPNYQITDYTKSSPASIEFTAYPISQIEAFVFNGDYGLVQIRGLDEEIYVTMIDVQGNELITPIKGRYLDEFVLAPNGYAYYRQNNVYYIVDKNNNVTITDINWYVLFDGSQEVGRICNYFDGISYIKPNGEKLFDHLKVQ